MSCEGRQTGQELRYTTRKGEGAGSSLPLLLQRSAPACPMEKLSQGECRMTCSVDASLNRMSEDDSLTAYVPVFERQPSLA